MHDMGYMQLVGREFLLVLMGVLLVGVNGLDPQDALRSSPPGLSLRLAGACVCTPAGLALVATDRLVGSDDGRLVDAFDSLSVLVSDSATVSTAAAAAAAAAEAAAAAAAAEAAAAEAAALVEGEETLTAAEQELEANMEVVIQFVELVLDDDLSGDERDMLFSAMYAALPELADTHEEELEVVETWTAIIATGVREDHMKRIHSWKMVFYGDPGYEEAVTEFETHSQSSTAASWLSFFSDYYDLFDSRAPRLDPSEREKVIAFQKAIRAEKPNTSYLEALRLFRNQPESDQHDPDSSSA